MIVRTTIEEDSLVSMPPGDYLDGQMENIIDNIDRGWSCHDSVILCDAVMLHSVAYLSRSLISSGLIGNIQYHLILYQTLISSILKVF